MVHALYGVGTSLTVTKAPAAPKAGQPPPGAITIGPGGSASGGFQSGNTGILGGAAGVGLGYAAAQVITVIAPSLSATVGTAPPAASQSGGSFLGGHVSGATAPHTVPVHLTAPVPASVIIVAVALALAGGLLSGSLGSWRIAQLRPAAALARVG